VSRKPNQAGRSVRTKASGGITALPST
jgi:hypothetical protein